MFTLFVEAESSDFLIYLEKESTKVDSNTYLFSTVENANKILARYMFYHLRKLILKDIAKKHRLQVEQIERLVLYVSSQDIMNILMNINHHIYSFLQNNNYMHFEGFVSFRLKKEQDLLNASYKKALHDFYEYERENSNINSLIRILHEHEMKEQKMFIYIDKDKQIILRSEDKIYLVEEMNNQDVILSHLISIAPKKVLVNEYYGTLSKETVVILKQLFREKVEFVREKHSFN